jgi:leucyl/phenylalanyl-tRNA--protein transferase
MSARSRGEGPAGPDPDFPWLSGDQRIEFPDPAGAPDFAPLAHGGNLSPGMLLSAYHSGIFPWYAEDDPVLWWSPNPRFVIFPAKAHLSGSMRKVLRQGCFTITADTVFPQVIRHCSMAPRPGQDGTWIGEEFIRGYTELHALGHAHSVEAWQDGELVGGLYGVSVGSVFCGESMFSKATNASKAAFLTLARWLDAAGVPVIDSQVHTELFESLGAEHIPRDEYLAILAANRDRPLLHGSWTGRYPDITW